MWCIVVIDKDLYDNDSMHRVYGPFDSMEAASAYQEEILENGCRYLILKMASEKEHRKIREANH